MAELVKSHHVKRLWVVLALLLIGLNLLAGYGVMLQHSALDDDADGYNRIARNMVYNGAYSYCLSAPLVPECKRTPGYPAFVAAIYAMTNGSVLAVISIQTVLFFGISYLVYLLALHKMGRNEAIAAALLAGVSPTFIITSKMLFSETLGVFLFLWSLLLLLRVKGWRLLFISAILLDFAILVRPSMLSLVIPILIYIWVQKRPMGIVPIHIVAWLILTIMGSAGWMIRNYVVFKTPQLSSLPAIQTYNYEAKTAAAIHWSRTHGQLKPSHMYTRAYPMPASFWAELNRKHGAPSWMYRGNDSTSTSAWLVDPAPPVVNGAEMDGFAQAEYYQSIGKAIIKDYPLDWAFGVACGIARFWVPPYATIYPKVVPADAPVIGRYLFILASVIYWAVMVLCGLWGLVCALKKPVMRNMAALVVSVILFANLSVLSQGQWRYRMAIEPLLAIFAVYALNEWRTNRMSSGRNTH